MPAPKPEPRLTARAIRPLVSGLRALGHDPVPLLASAGIESAVLDEPDAHVPMRAAVSLITRAVEATRDSNLGLRLAQSADLGSFDVHLYAMLSSGTLGAAYVCLCRYQRLIHETTRVELQIEGDHAVLGHRMPGGMAAPRHSAEFIVAAWVRAGRLATGTDWAPAEVRFAHPRPPDPGAHESFFRSAVRFDTGENALVLPTPLLATPCVRADPALLAVLDRYAADRLAVVPQTTSFADRARAALAEDLARGEPRAQRLAARLKTSERTLNRALAAEGTSYRELLDQLRKELAARRLSDDRVSISEVAFLLGFSELSAFYRAFKRWTGMTPAEFRRRGAFGQRF
jgi:AraC-like DNA-binding protein